MPTLADLFADVVDLPPEARAARLADIPADLRAEVEALVRAERQSGDEMTRLDRLAEASGGFTGETLRGYEVIEEIGRGGMGVVYRARDVRLGRTVALKVLPRALSADPEARARLEAEARAASALDHPNVCTVHALEETDDGRLVLVLAHYAGETLKARLARGPLPPAEATGVLRQMAAGLAAAHEAGIVHRDVKPSNVLVEGSREAKGIRDEGSSTPHPSPSRIPYPSIRILDFGIARSAESDLTQTGATLGTAAYMAPEQTRGVRADTRADVWALGIVLYEMLTGSRPFTASGEALVHAIRHDDPPPLPPGTPEILSRVARRALAKDPADRYADAGALLDDLDAAPSASAPRRARWLVPAGAILALVALAFWWVRPGAEPPEDVFVIAVAPFSALGDGADAEAGLMQDLIHRELAGVLGEEPDVRLVELNGDAPTTDAEAQSLGTQANAHLVVWGEAAVLRDEVEIRPRLTRARPVEGLLAPPERRAEGVGDVITSLAAEDALGLRRTRAAEVGDLALLVAAHYQIARGRFGRAVALYDRVRQPSVESESGAGLALMLAGDFTASAERYDRAASLGEIPTALSFGYANTFVQLGRVLEASVVMEASVARDPDDAVSTGVLAWLYAIQGRFGEMRETAARAAAQEPGSQIERLAVGWARFMVQDYEAALLAFRAMADHAGNATERAWAYQGLGQIFFSTGRFPEAAGAYRHGIAADSMDDESTFGLGWSLVATGDLEGAEAAFGRVRQIHRPQYLLDAVLAQAYVRARLGRADALAPIRATADTLSGEGRFHAAFGFPLGQTTEAEVLDAATRPDPDRGAPWEPEAHLALAMAYETGLGAAPRDSARAAAHLRGAAPPWAGDGVWSAARILAEGLGR